MLIIWTAIFLVFLSIFFSCVQQSDEEAADNPAEMEMTDPTETEPSVFTEDTAASPQSTPESEPGPQESLQEIQAPSNVCQPPGGSAEALDATSRAHLFIFDSESQEVESSQVSSGDGLAPVRPNLQQAVKTISNISLTQARLEADKQRLTELMSETRQVSDTCTLCFYHLGLVLSVLVDFNKMRYDLPVCFPGLGQCDQSSAEDQRRLL